MRFLRLLLVQVIETVVVLRLKRLQKLMTVELAHEGSVTAVNFHNHTMISAGKDRVGRLSHDFIHFESN